MKPVVKLFVTLGTELMTTSELRKESDIKKRDRVLRYRGNTASMMGYQNIPEDWIALEFVRTEVNMADGGEIIARGFTEQLLPHSIPTELASQLGTGLIFDIHDVQIQCYLSTKANQAPLARVASGDEVGESVAFTHVNSTEPKETPATEPTFEIVEPVAEPPHASETPHITEVKKEETVKVEKVVSPPLPEGKDAKFDEFVDDVILNQSVLGLNVAAITASPLLYGNKVIGSGMTEDDEVLGPAQEEEEEFPMWAKVLIGVGATAIVVGGSIALYNLGKAKTAAID
jgi:hypothetical protein